MLGICILRWAAVGAFNLCDRNCFDFYFLKINVLLFLNSQVSIYSRITLRSVPKESESLASPSASTSLSVLQLNLMLM